MPSYGNIIGCLILETTSNSTQPLIVTHVNGNKIAGSRIGTSSGINISANDNNEVDADIDVEEDIDIDPFTLDGFHEELDLDDFVNDEH